MLLGRIGIFNYNFNLSSASCGSNKCKIRTFAWSPWYGDVTGMYYYTRTEATFPTTQSSGIITSLHYRNKRIKTYLPAEAEGLEAGVQHRTCRHADIMQT